MTKNYWQGRQKKLNKGIEKDEKELANKLNDFYGQNIRSLEKAIGSYYTEYGYDNVIQYKDLMKRLDKADASLLMKNMDAFAAKYPEYANLIPVRKSIYKLNRLEGIHYAMKMQTLELGAKEAKVIKAHLDKWAKEAYTAAMGFGDNFNNINVNLAKALVSNKWVDGKDYSQRIWDHKNKLSNYMQKEFTSGVIRGDSYEKMSQMLRQRMGVSKNSAMRLIYTEGTYVMNEASAKAFEDMYDEYVYSPIGDAKTCNICSGISGTVFKFKDRKPGINFPPMHPRCRCSFEVVVDIEVEKEKSNKGKTKEYIASMAIINSADYINKFSVFDEDKNIKRSMYNETRAIIEHRNGTPYEDLVFIDTNTGLIKKSVDYEVERTARPTKKMKKLIREAEESSVVAIHNHPGSMPPSFNDLKVAEVRGYKYGIVACHNGDIYKYRVIEKGKLIESNAKVALAIIEKNRYNKRAIEMLKDIGIEMEVL